MKYIKVEKNTPIDYSIAQLLIDHPNAVIYEKSQMPSPQLLANYNVYPLVTEAPPKTTAYETAEESIPDFQKGEWHQTWTIKKLSEAELKEIIEQEKKLQQKAQTGLCPNC